MLTDFLFDRTVIPTVEQSLNTYSLRQKALANNVSNAMTPGYKAQKVSFEEELRNSLDETHIKGNRTNSKHFDIGSSSSSIPVPVVELKEDRMNDTGVNNVDIDKEMAEMAENSLRYEMSTKFIIKRFNGIRTAIRGR